MDKKIIDIKAIFLKAFVLYRESLSLLMSLGLIYAISTECGQVFFKGALAQAPGMLFLVNMFISAFVSIALIYAASEIYQGRVLDLNGAFAPVKGKYWNYVTVSIGFFVVVLSGILCFVIPGAYLGTIFVFADLLVVLENKALLEAFKRSKELVWGYFWQVFLFSMITACFLVIPGLILGAFRFNGLNIGRILQMCSMVFIIPYITMVQVGLYYRMKEIKNRDTSLFSE